MSCDVKYNIYLDTKAMPQEFMKFKQKIHTYLSWKAQNPNVKMGLVILISVKEHILVCFYMYV